MREHMWMCECVYVRNISPQIPLPLQSCHVFLNFYLTPFSPVSCKNGKSVVSMLCVIFENVWSSNNGERERSPSVGGNLHYMGDVVRERTRQETNSLYI